MRYRIQRGFRVLKRHGVDFPAPGVCFYEGTQGVYEGEGFEIFAEETRPGFIGCISAERPFYNDTIKAIIFELMEASGLRAFDDGSDKFYCRSEVERHLPKSRIEENGYTVTPIDAPEKLWAA